MLLVVAAMLLDFQALFDLLLVARGVIVDVTALDAFQLHQILLGFRRHKLLR